MESVVRHGLHDCLVESTADTRADEAADNAVRNAYPI